ncbi:MAG: hypothetical protein WKG32_21620 [Gemmatimonadaceae bacterium]
MARRLLSRAFFAGPALPVRSLAVVALLAPSLALAPVRLFGQATSGRTRAGDVWRTAEEPRAAKVPAAPAPAAGPVRALRAPEVYAAPWVDGLGGPTSHGELLERADVSAALTADRRWLSHQDRVYASLPPGAVAQIGDRYLIVALGAEVGTSGQVVAPTGIGEVVASGQGDAPTLQIVRQFGAVKLGQWVLPLARLPLPTSEPRSGRDLGVQSRVVWIASDALLPSLQDYLILDAAFRDGVTIGDRFTLLRPRVQTPGGATLPEEPIALVEVVRVTQRGSTVIILDQRHGAIQLGTPARLTAKMP